MKFFLTKNINFITQLFYSDGSVKNWNNLKTEYALQNKDNFYWLQLINAIPEMRIKMYQINIRKRQFASS